MPELRDQAVIAFERDGTLSVPQCFYIGIPGDAVHVLAHLLYLSGYRWNEDTDAEKVGTRDWFPATVKELGHNLEPARKRRIRRDMRRAAEALEVLHDAGLIDTRGEGEVKINWLNFYMQAEDYAEQCDDFARKHGHMPWEDAPTDSD